MSTEPCRPNHAGAGQAVAKPRTLGRRYDQDDTQDTKGRQSVHKPQDVADQCSAETRMSPAYPNDSHSYDPLPDSRPEQAFKNTVIGKHGNEEDEAKRIEDEPAGDPVVIPGRHEPDSFYPARHREEDGGKEQAINGECREADLKARIPRRLR